MKIIQNDEQPPMSNPNIEWAALFVNELARCGLTAVCIAPGSRSTPLALAFHAHPGIKVYVHLDERSASFFALGMALAEKKTVALVCTSGSATANFHPAVVEAQMSQIPLLLMTADRPHELRQSGANQTIDQIKMFGDHVLWAVDVALPQVDAPDLVLRYLQTLAARAMSSANGILKGPVHLNFPFRKPLEPFSIAGWQEVVGKLGGGQPHARIETGSLQVTESQLSFMADIVNKSAHGLIICSPGCPGGDFPEAVARLSRASGYPILADALSGVRFGSHVENTAVIGGYESFLQGEISSWAAPDLILRFGAVPTSKWLNNYLHRNKTAYHIHVQESGVWADGDHVTNHFLQAAPADLCQRLTAQITRTADEEWLGQWTTAESNYKTILSAFMDQNFFDGTVAFSLLNQIPNGAALFVGNSLAIRHIDQFCPPQQKSVSIFANRGASGIDGNISTGLGIAARKTGPVVLLLGDISFYHDSNGLLAIKKFGLNNVTIILLNNNGGGIFHRLPVSQFEPEFQELFLTPHDLQFEALAKLYDLNYKMAGDLETLKLLVGDAIRGNGPTLIEVQTDAQTDDLTRREIVSIVNSKFTRK